MTGRGMVSHYIAVGLGGAFGAIFRVGISRLLPSILWDLPFQILCINGLGCLLMGLLTGVMTLHWPLSDYTRYFLIPGFLGGFTTFSAFALEFGLLVEKQEYISAIFYGMLSCGLCLALFFAGLKGVRLFS